MRTLNELYKLLLIKFLSEVESNEKCISQITKNIYSLCRTIDSLFHCKIITENEYFILNIHFSKQHNEDVHEEVFWFNMYDEKPRIELLESLIESTKNLNNEHIT